MADPFKKTLMERIRGKRTRDIQLPAEGPKPDVRGSVKEAFKVGRDIMRGGKGGVESLQRAGRLALERQKAREKERSRSR